MARLLTYGFELGSMLEIVGASTGTPTFPTGRTTIGAATGKCIQVGSGSTMQMDFASGVTEFYLSVALSWNGNAGSSGMKFAFVDGSANNVLRLSYSPAGVFQLQVGGSGTTYSGTALMTAASTSTWRLFELHFKLASGTSGMIETRVDGVTDISQTAINTNPDSRTNITRISYATASAPVVMDDFVVNDTSGGSNNSWIGDKRLYLLTPDGNGSVNQWTNSAGTSTNNYTYVDEIPPNSDTDYVQSVTTGQVDAYSMSNLPTLSAGDTISAVFALAIAKRSNAGTAGNMRCNIKSSSTTDNGPSTNIPTAYGPVKGNLLTTDPATGIAWTSSGVNAIESQVEVL